MQGDVVNKICTLFSITRGYSRPDSPARVLVGVWAFQVRLVGFTCPDSPARVLVGV